MADELKYADSLLKSLRKSPEIFIYHQFQDTLYDPESGETDEIEDNPFCINQIKPNKKTLHELSNNLIQEIRVNRFKFANFSSYITLLYKAYSSVYEEEIKIVNTEMYNFRKGIQIFYDYHSEANPNPIENLDILPKETLYKIQAYCQFQKNTIHDIIRYLNGLIPEDLEIDNLDELVKDEKDPRIFVGIHPEKIRQYFSFLSQKTSSGQRIMSEEDLECFLSFNFQGFPINTEKRELSFDLIKGVDFRHIIYCF